VVSRVEIKNLQRSEQAHFLVSRIAALPLDFVLAAIPRTLVFQCEPARRLGEPKRCRVHYLETCDGRTIQFIV